ncbi:MAG: energy transducer TonB [Flavobacteriales bacterium]
MKRMRSLLSFFTIVVVLLIAPVACAQAVDPEPFGGKADLQLFIDDELVYPAAELAQGISGPVNLIFTVNSDGRVSALRIWQSLNPACDAEALRIARLVRWFPATFDGEPRATEHYLRIEFDAKRYARLEKKRTLPRAVILDADTSGILYKAAELDSLPQPMILGGLRGLPNYLGEHMRYPKDAFARSLEGTVRLEFTVEATGNIGNVRALQSVGGGCTDEARRLIRSMRWTPGKKNGKRVRSAQEVSIVFKLGTTQR